MSPVTAKYMLYITNKTERSSFESGCVVQVVKRFKKPLHSVAIAIKALNCFILLLISLVTNILKFKARLKAKFKCVSVTI